MSYDIKLEMVPVLVCAVTDTLRDFRMPDAVLDRKDVSDISVQRVQTQQIKTNALTIKGATLVKFLGSLS